LLLESAGAFGTLLVAVLAVIWPDELKAMSAGDWSLKAGTFIFAVLLTLGASISSIASRRAAERRARVTSALERKVRALCEALPRALDPYRSERPDAAVRLALLAITEAAWSFDGKPKGSRYASNVMIFTATEPRTAAFRDPEVPTIGFLVLHRELSTAIPGTEGRPRSDHHRAGVARPEGGRTMLARCSDRVSGKQYGLLLRYN